MPYFNHSMAQSMRQSSKDPNQKEPKSVMLRSMPGGSSSLSKNADPQFTAKYTQKVPQRKLLFNRSLLKAQIEQVREQQGALPIQQAQNLFNVYQIDYKNKLYEDEDHSIFPAKNTQQPEFSMVALIYPTAKLDPQKSFYLKILRHLGRKHPYIVNTWEIFYNNTDVIIFQEFVPKGNLISYLETTKVDEKQVCFWAKQLFRALDFLGDNGISHRDINPHHLMIKPIGREVWIKLTGFKNSIIYYNCEENDINFVPCIPIAQQKNDGPNFQAPEVYGNENEYFDPILADTWSYGANLFFSLAKFYPYNVEFPHEDLDEEIWHNILKVPNISEECQQFLFSLMRSNANDRIPFDFIDKDKWICQSYTLPSRQIVARSAHKYMEKVKFKGDVKDAINAPSVQPSGTNIVSKDGGSMDSVSVAQTTTIVEKASTVVGSSKNDSIEKSRAKSKSGHSKKSFSGKSKGATSHHQQSANGSSKASEKVSTKISQQPEHEPTI